MSMPLPLELTKPAVLADDLDSLVRAQLCGGTSSCNNTQTLASAGIVIDSADVQVDDNDIDVL
jgi:hypothetical protein